jgi:hypothetical protein
MNLSTFTRMIYLAAMAGLLAMSLAGCHRERGREKYRYEHGDRIDSRGHRDSGWCDHHHDEHCR